MARSLEYIQKEILRVYRKLNINDEFALNRSDFLSNSDVTKHDLSVYGGWIKVRTDAWYSDKYIVECSTKDVVASRGIEIRNAANRAAERDKATKDYFAEKVSSSILSHLKANPIKVPPAAKLATKAAPDGTVVNVLLSDLHFGIDVDPNEVLASEYNWTVASRRLGYLVKVIDDGISPLVKKIRVFLNGDILHGVIHIDDANLKPMTEQFVGALQLLTDFICSLHNLTRLPVEVICTPGNHDRMTYKTPQRTVSQRWDAFSSLLYVSLEAAFKDIKNITFHIPMSGIAVVDLPSGGVLISTHGDTCPEVGNVSKSINTERIRQNIYNMTATSAVKKPIEAVVYGHWHTPTMQMLPTGQVVLVNGSLIGSDTYAQNAVGYFNSKPAQLVFFSNKEQAVHDVNIVQFHEHINSDKELNKYVRVPVIHERGNLKGVK